MKTIAFLILHPLTQFIAKVADIDETRVEQILVLERCTGVGVDEDERQAGTGDAQLTHGNHEGAHSQRKAAEDALDSGQFR